MYLEKNAKTFLWVEDDDALRSRLGTAMQKRRFMRYMRAIRQILRFIQSGTLDEGQSPCSKQG